MPGTISQYIPLLFILTTALAGWIFLQANKNLKAVSVIIIAWMILQTLLARSGFYFQTTGMPPRLMFAILPPLLLIIASFALPAGRRYLDTLDPRMLTWLHVVRIPVEITLYLLMIHNLVPMLMTFEGRNFDIFSGLTAPFIAYFGYTKQKLPKIVLLVWNFVCLFLLATVVYYGVLSAPTPFQKYSFNQPNMAVLLFPFVWLPSFIVPLVLFSHLVCIRSLLRGKTV